ncbi:hypothetical protein CDAR_416211 [Caerostris darwini]|uniref:Uncharacterized protein n=1 Tax=Caerostris darwini TaxID=1538125 RepID=A0AAV4W628_9ARAC|nr:hypothetical protein CDAR_416211 [Caerostris darwini]
MCSTGEKKRDVHLSSRFNFLEHEVTDTKEEKKMFIGETIITVVWAADNIGRLKRCPIHRYHKSIKCINGRIDFVIASPFLTMSPMSKSEVL